jgi:hypothetical protein
MATTAYESALEIAASLSRDEQLRLIQELTVRAAQAPASEGNQCARVMRSRPGDPAAHGCPGVCTP